MKFLDKLGLAIFSLITLILSILVCLITFGWIDVSIISVGLTNAVASQNGMYNTIGHKCYISTSFNKMLIFPQVMKDVRKNMTMMMKEYYFKMIMVNY